MFSVQWIQRRRELAISALDIMTKFFKKNLNLLVKRTHYDMSL